MSEHEQKIRKRVMCEERAFRIVERLVEGSTTEEFLNDAAQYITPDHYADIVVERAIEKLCGYPICSNLLGKVLKQKYHISTKSNKVFDITDRKNFCSNCCYKASKYFQIQIPVVPVWAREECSRINFSHLNDDQRGSKGEEVISQEKIAMKNQLQQSENIDKVLNRREMEDAEVIEMAMDKLEIKEHPIVITDSDSTKDDTMDFKNTVLEQARSRAESKNLVTDDADSSHYAEHSQLSPKSENLYLEHAEAERENIECSRLSDFVVMHKDSDDSDDNEDDSQNFDQKKYDDGTCVKVDKIMTLLDKNKNMLSNMVLLETVEIGRGKEKCENTKTTKQESDSCLTSRTVNVKKNSVSEESMIKESNQLKTCKQSEERTSYAGMKLCMIDLICGGVSDWITERTLQYLGFCKCKKPSTESAFEMKGDFKSEALLSDRAGESSQSAKKAVPDFKEFRKMEDYELKVTQFVQGNYTYKVKEQEKKENTESDEHIILPVVDSHDQLLIRQRIVLDKLNKIIPELLPPLKLSIQNIFTELRELVATFSLSSENIMYKPAEWSLVALLLLKLLAQRIPKVEEAFKLKSAVNYFTVLLRAIKMTLLDLDQYVYRLCRLHDKSSETMEWN